MNFNSKPISGDIINPIQIPTSTIIKSYTFKSKQLESGDKAEYSIVYNPKFTFGMAPKGIIVPKCNPPIMKGVFNSTDITNWKPKYKQMYEQAYAELYKQGGANVAKAFAARDARWVWMESRVPDWKKRLISLHEEIRERFKGIGLTENSMISVFLDKNDWKNFKSGNMKVIELISCDAP